MLDNEKAIQSIFQACSVKVKFTAKDILEQFAVAGLSPEEKYQHDKQITQVLTFLERSGLIQAWTRPEYTQNFRLTLEIREGVLTKVGKAVAFCPESVRVFCFWFLLKKNSIISILGAFAFLNLCRNAYLGVLFAAGWLENISVAIVLFVLFALLRRALG